MNSPTSVSWCVERRRGVRKAVRAAGRDPDAVILEVDVPDLTVAAGEVAAAAVLALRLRPTAVICVNDLLALGVLRAFAAHGVRVPDDIALVGYDDVEFAAVLSPPLTSVRQPSLAMGRAAAEMLFARPAAIKTVRFAPELVVRASSVRHTKRSRS